MTAPDLIPVAVSPTPATLYYGNPDIIKLASGKLLVSHDEFGASAHTNSNSRTDRSHVVASEDNGATWSRIATTDGMHMPAFIQGVEGLYRVGVSAWKESVVISESTDEGVTWGTPVVIDSSHFYGQAPFPPLIKDGVLYMLMVADSDYTWPWEGIVMLSCPVGDLMTAESWTVGAKFTTPSGIYGISESFAITDTSGEIRVFVRVDSATQVCQILECTVGVDLTLTLSKRYSFDGGNVKFQIVKDEVSGDYFLARNSLPISDGLDRRTLLVLDRSSDLIYWRRVLTFARNEAADYAAAGIQYPSIIIDGDDLLAVIRMGKKGVAQSYHNSNQIDFCRIQDFRKL